MHLQVSVFFHFFHHLISFPFAKNETAQKPSMQRRDASKTLHYNGGSVPLADRLGVSNQSSLQDLWMEGLLKWGRKSLISGH